MLATPKHAEQERKPPGGCLWRFGLRAHAPSWAPGSRLYNGRALLPFDHDPEPLLVMPTTEGIAPRFQKLDLPQLGIFVSGWRGDGGPTFGAGNPSWLSILSVGGKHETSWAFRLFWPNLLAPASTCVRFVNGFRARLIAVEWAAVRWKWLRFTHDLHCRPAEGYAGSTASSGFNYGGGVHRIPCNKLVVTSRGARCGSSVAV